MKSVEGQRLNVAFHRQMDSDLEKEVKMKNLHL